MRGMGKAGEEEGVSDIGGLLGTEFPEPSWPPRGHLHSEQEQGRQAVEKRSDLP